MGAGKQFGLLFAWMVEPQIFWNFFCPKKIRKENGKQTIKIPPWVNPLNPFFVGRFFFLFFPISFFPLFCFKINTKRFLFFFFKSRVFFFFNGEDRGFFKQKKTNGPLVFFWGGFFFCEINLLLCGVFVCIWMGSAKHQSLTYSFGIPLFFYLVFNQKFWGVGEVPGGGELPFFLPPPFSVRDSSPSSLFFKKI